MMNIYINKLEKLSEKEIESVVRNLEEIHRDLTDEDFKKTCEMLIDIVESEKGLNKKISEYHDNKFMCDSYELLGAGEEDKEIQKQMLLSEFHIEDFVNAIHLLEDITGKNALEGVQSLKYYVEEDDIIEIIKIEDKYGVLIMMKFEFQKLNDSLARDYSDLFSQSPTC